jgi:hypothetical protein
MPDAALAFLKEAAAVVSQLSISITHRVFPGP